MKKLFLVGMVSLFALSSCRKDDDNDSNSAIQIVGKWSPLKTVVYSGTNNSELLSVAATTCEKKSSYTFRADNYVVTDGYTENGNNGCQHEGVFTDPYTYDPVTKILTIDDETVQVKSLTANELHIEGETDGDINDDGVDDKFVVILVR